MKNTALTHGENTLAPALFPASFLAHGHDANSSEEETNEQAHNAPTRARLKFDDNDGIAPPEGFSNRETWTAAVWLNALAQNGAKLDNKFIALPPAEADEIRRWFFHRWEAARDGKESPAVAGALAGIGQLARVQWSEVAAHYRRCPWFDVIQEAFAAAREANLKVDRSRETVVRRRDAIGFFLRRPLSSCRELSRDEWTRVGEAIRSGALRW